MLNMLDFNMSKKDKIKIFLGVLGFCLVVTIVISIGLLREINNLKNASPYLNENDTINEAVLLDSDGNPYNLKELSKEKTLIYVFRLPCLTCNQNLYLIKRLQEAVGKKLKILGIVPSSPQQAFEFEEKAKLDFKILIPENLKDFKDSVKLKENTAFTMLCKNSKIEFIRYNDLRADDITSILKFSKKQSK